MRRHPSRTVPSSARLFETLVGIALPTTQSGLSELADRRKVGLYAAQYVGDQWKPMPGDDDTEPGHPVHTRMMDRVVQVKYSDFIPRPHAYLRAMVADNPTVLGTAPGGCGLTWTDEWEARFSAYERDNDARRAAFKERGIAGGNWTAADVGMTEEELVRATGVPREEVEELKE
ncbi:hypothetical protein HDU93_002137 [Gonapodya sp. JEL0774]|nr:hypothetical protein HDU93_002137 [Gonapodya sp. JEL0774]